MTNKQKWGFGLLFFLVVFCAVWLPLSSQWATDLATRPDYPWLWKEPGVDYINHRFEKQLFWIFVVGGLIFFGLPWLGLLVGLTEGGEGGCSHLGRENPIGAGVRNKNSDHTDLEGSNMLEKCPDCDGNRDFDRTRGNGKCADCHGSGNFRTFMDDVSDTVADTIGGQKSNPTCTNCRGSGECPTCDGQGVL